MPQTSGAPIPAVTAPMAMEMSRLPVGIERERDAHHEPQRGDGLAGHEAGAERVPHVETAHEAAGFACEDEIFGHTSPW